MRSKLVAALCAVLTSVGCARNTPPPAGHSDTVAASRLVHDFDHVIVIVLENEDAARVDAVPYMDSLTHVGVRLRDYYAVAHPSYPNYLALVSGRTFIDPDSRVRHDPDAYKTLDFGDAQLLINAPTIVDRLQSAGLSWDVFGEDYPDSSAAPTRCDWRRSLGKYARKHVPFLSFSGFHEHPQWCAHVRDVRWFNKDSLAAYTFIAPNLIHDGHDAPLDSAVTWLRGILPPILADSAIMKRTLIVVTFDESSNPLIGNITGFAPNRIYTVLLGGMLRSGVPSDVTYSHYSLLRTIELNFGLAPSLLPSDVNPITGVWEHPVTEQQ